MLHIGRNIISLMISRVGAAVILFLIYTRLLEYLGKEAAGQYGLIAAYITVFSFFVDLGMQQLVIKKVSENREEAGKYLGNYFALQFVLGVIFMLIMAGIVIASGYPPLVRNALLIASVGLLLSSLTMPLMAIINSFQKLSLIAKVNFANSMINAGMMLLAILMRKNILFLAFIPVVISAFDVLVYGYLVNKKFTKFRLEFDWAFWKQLILWNLPFMGLTIFSIYNRIDSLLLPHLRNFTEAGLYAAAYKFWDILAFLPAVVGASLYPYFADRLVVGAREEVKEVLETYTRYMVAIGVPLSIGAYFLAEKILAFFTPTFVAAAPALWMLVTAVAILFIYVPVNSIIISQRTKWATIVTACTLLFNLIAIFIFVPKLGFVAAAGITIVSELIQLVGYTWITKRKIIDFPYVKNFIKPIVAGIVMAVMLYYLNNLSLWYLIVIGAVVYFIALAALKFFIRHDWELLKASVNFRKKIEPPNVSYEDKNL